MMTASRRANATMPFMAPRRCTIFMAQAFNHDHFCERNSIAWAAS